MLTTNSNQGYSETFMGDEGNAGDFRVLQSRIGLSRAKPPRWIGTQWVKLGFINAPKEEEKKADSTVAVDVRETLAPPGL